MLFITQQKRTAPSGLDAAETVRFSWKVVEPQGQREHDVRVSRLTPWMASVGGPVMMRSTWPLSFRKSTVVASIRVRGWQPFLRGFYGPLRYETAASMAGNTPRSTRPSKSTGFTLPCPIPTSLCREIRCSWNPHFR